VQSFSSPGVLSIPFCLQLCASAVAARVLGRPVKMQLSRQTDLTMNGGREETDSQYEVSMPIVEIIAHFRFSCLMESCCASSRLNLAMRPASMWQLGSLRRLCLAVACSSQVAFDKEGKISALRNDGVKNSGWTVDLSWCVRDRFVQCCRVFGWGCIARVLTSFRTTIELGLASFGCAGSTSTRSRRL
jgi:xanthine dehydrogenase molybdopterin-binding subunit B